VLSRIRADFPHQQSSYWIRYTEIVYLRGLSGRNSPALSVPSGSATAARWVSPVVASPAGPEWAPVWGRLSAAAHVGRTFQMLQVCLTCTFL
jgi:hypothetical protein